MKLIEALEILSSKSDVKIRLSDWSKDAHIYRKNDEFMWWHIHNLKANIPSIIRVWNHRDDWEVLYEVE